MKKIKEVEVDWLILATIEQDGHTGERAYPPLILSRTRGTNDAAQTALYDVADACRDNALDDGDRVSALYEDRAHLWYTVKHGRRTVTNHFWRVQDIDD